ncbi:MAG: hypothetical protein J2P41_23545 [Blastocatellia bacterium]|nr:hypothetical protein [Blastocatellia bacterium]
MLEEPLQQWSTVRGVIVRGHEVASKKSEHYPAGTIAMQIPFFRERGLDLTPYYRATLNISISPYKLRVTKAEYRFPRVDWTSKHPPEDFSFSRCRLIYAGEKHEGWIYYPHPETKIRHYQNDSLIEVIAHYIRGISYGARIELLVNPAEIALEL